MAPIFQDFIWVDYGILGLIGISAIIGLTRGLLKEVFSLALWAGAGWVALHYNHDLSVHLEKAISLPSARLAAAFIIIFVAVLIAGGMVLFLLGKLVSGTGLGGTDRLAGLLFGVARGCVIAAVLVMLAGVTPLPQDPWWKQSKLIPPFQALAVWLRDQFPQGLAAEVKFPEVIVHR